MKKITPIQNRKGMTGLETAIILVAFVITASAFAFVVLNMGFLTAEQSQSVISAGMSEASSALLVDSDLIGTFANLTGSQDNVGLSKVVFYVKLGQGDIPMDMDTGKLVISYTNQRGHVSVYDTNGTITTIKGVNNDGDSLLEKGERFKISIVFTSIAKADMDPAQTDKTNVYAHPYEEISIEIRPASGGVTIIDRVIPQVGSAVQAF